MQGPIAGVGTHRWERSFAHREYQKRTSSSNQKLERVRFTPESGHGEQASARPLCAISGHWLSHSITSSARALARSTRLIRALAPLGECASVVATLLRLVRAISKFCVQRRPSGQRVAQNRHVRRQLVRPSGVTLSQHLLRCLPEQRYRVSWPRLFRTPSPKCWHNHPPSFRVVFRAS